MIDFRISKFQEAIRKHIKKYDRTSIFWIWEEGEDMCMVPYKLAEYIRDTSHDRLLVSKHQIFLHSELNIFNYSPDIWKEINKPNVLYVIDIRNIYYDIDLLISIINDINKGMKNILRDELKPYKLNVINDNILTYSWEK